MIGNEANNSGYCTEKIVYTILRETLGQRGYIVSKDHVFKTHELKQVPMCVQDNSAMKVDFFVPGVPGFEGGVIFSVKVQHVTGTAQQKLSYHFSEEIPAHPHPTMLVIIGDAWQSGVHKRVTELVKAGQIHRVFRSFDELYNWARQIPARDFSQAVYRWKGVSGKLKGATFSQIGFGI